MALSSFGQQIQIGQWRDYLPFNDATSVANLGDKIYVATENSLFYLDIQDQMLNRLSTTSGLSDVGVATMAKAPQKNTLIVAYNSTKIDIIEDNRISSNEQNDDFSTLAADFLDFSEDNPFGDPENN